MAQPAAPAPRMRKMSSVIQFVGERQDEKELRELFNVADKQKSGAIGPSQLRIILRELGVNAGEEEAQLLFEGLDINNDGKISFQEFTAGISWLKKSLTLNSSALNPAAPASAPAAPAPAPSPKAQLTRKKSIAEFARDSDPAIIAQCKELFSMMDEKHKGEISLQRFSSVFRELDLAATDAEVADLFRQLDVNGDGSISFAEFMSGMQRLNKAFSATAKLTESAKAPLPSESETLTAENALLKRYLRENFIEKSIRRAERALELNDVHAAKITLEMLDMPRIEKLEEYVGTLTTVELNERYERCRLAVAKTLTRP